MENDMHQRIEQRLSELPEDVQAAIASSEFDEKLRVIGTAHALHIDQMEVLGDEVMLAMLGFADLDDLPRGIEEHVHIDATKAQAIAEAVNKEIFMPIRESMKAWARNRGAGGTVVSTPVASAPSATASTASVVMPSSAKPVTAPAPASTLTPAQAPVAPPVPAPLPQAAQTPNLAAADAILSEKKVTPPTAAPVPPAPAAPAAPKADSARPQPYKADPYREPVE